MLKKAQDSPVVDARTSPCPMSAGRTHSVVATLQELSCHAGVCCLRELPIPRSSASCAPPHPSCPAMPQEYSKGLQVLYNRKEHTSDCEVVQAAVVLKERLREEAARATAATGMEHVPPEVVGATRDDNMAGANVSHGIGGALELTSSRGQQLCRPIV